MVDYLIKNPETPVIVIMLAVALITLWKLYSNYTSRVVTENEGYRKGLEERNKLLEEELSHQRESRELEWKEHYNRMEELSSGYKQSMDHFSNAMQEVQNVLSNQIKLLNELVGLPKKVDKIEKDVDEVWKFLRSEKGANQ